MSRRIARDAFFKDPGSNSSTASGIPTKQEFNYREREIEKESSASHITTGNVVTKSNAFTSSVKEDGSYVGYASLPNQVYRKSVKKGFDFTLMVVGKMFVFVVIIYLFHKVVHVFGLCIVCKVNIHYFYLVLQKIRQKRID